jgi:hypothetical protein
MIASPPISPWVAHNNRLYWYSTSPERSAVEQFLGDGVGLYTVIALAQHPGRWPPHNPLTRDDIREMALAVDHFAVDAYDFEGWVVWSRNRLL